MVHAQAGKPKSMKKSGQVENEILEPEIEGDKESRK